MNRALAVILPLIFLLIISFSAMLYFGLTSGGFSQVASKIKDTLKILATESQKPAPAVNSTSTIIINNNVSTSSAKVMVVTPEPTQAPVRPCYRYGSKCYTGADYNQLVSLSSDLASAKTFYQFDLDGVQRYQDEYDRTKSSVYLDAKASEQQQANRELDKINSITAQMQTIETRGW